MLSEFVKNDQQYHTLRIYYDIYTTKEDEIRKKLERFLPFYRLTYSRKLKETEIVYDTDKRLLTSANLVLSKRIVPDRVYFRVLKISTIPGQVIKNEKKTYLGECGLKDEPNMYPSQIANTLNRSFNNLFAVDMEEIIKHLQHFITISVEGEEYSIICGTGFSAKLSFETHTYRNERNKKKEKRRVCSLKMDENPIYEEEREHVLYTIEKYCKELVPFKKNRFEIAHTALFPPVPKDNGEERVKFDKKAMKKEKKGKKE